MMQLQLELIRIKVWKIIAVPCLVLHKVAHIKSKNLSNIPYQNTITDINKQDKRRTRGNIK